MPVHVQWAWDVCNAGGRSMARAFQTGEIVGESVDFEEMVYQYMAQHAKESNGWTVPRNSVRAWMAKSPAFRGRQSDALSDLLNKITDCTIEYLKAQAAAGAQALQIFDSWVGVLAPNDFAEFALPYVQRIIAALKASGVTVPIIYFANNGATLLPQSLESGADVLGLDWRLPLDEAVKVVGQRVSLQGNMDPIALLLPPAKMERLIQDILDQAKGARGHIFNLGHGIVPEIPPEQARFFVEAVHRLSRKG
jgi:uroporphyrinogen decarboxylase